MNLEQALAIIVGESCGSNVDADDLVFTAAAGLARIWRNHLAGKTPGPPVEICDSLFELLDGAGLEVNLSPEASPAIDAPRIVSMAELRRLRRAQRAVDDARRALLEVRGRRPHRPQRGRGGHPRHRRRRGALHPLPPAVTRRGRGRR
jgi:hypothetical protein